jgi:2-oxoglutarate dehydrogenase E1 component
MGMIRAYWWNGHEKAQLDPLQLEDFSQTGKKGKVQLHRLDHKYWGFSDADLDKEFTLSHPSLVGFLGHKKTWKLGEIISALENTYCNKIGAEFMHI